MDGRFAQVFWILLLASFLCFAAVVVYTPFAERAHPPQSVTFLESEGLAEFAVFPNLVR